METGGVDEDTGRHTVSLRPAAILSKSGVSPLLSPAGTASLLESEADGTRGLLRLGSFLTGVEVAGSLSRPRVSQEELLISLPSLGLAALLLGVSLAVTQFH